jgi:hypothetical protein
MYGTISICTRDAIGLQEKTPLFFPGLPPFSPAGPHSLPKHDLERSSSRLRRNRY